MGTVQSFQVAVQARSQKWGDAVIGFLNSSLWDFPLFRTYGGKSQKLFPYLGNTLRILCSKLHLNSYSSVEQFEKLDRKWG